MLYNYNFSLPTAFIYVIFTIYFFFNPILPVKRNRNFILLLFFQGLTIFTDIWASILCNDYQLYSIAYVYIINMLYFVSFISRIYFFAKYIISVPDSNDRIRLLSLFNHVFFIIFQGIFLSSFFTRWIFYVDNTGYHSGSYYNLIYFVMFVYIIEMYILMFLFRKYFSRREIIAGSMMITIIFIGTILRFHFPSLLVLNTFCNGAIIIIFLSFQDVHLYEDLRVGLFNNKAFHQYAIEHLNDNKLFLFGYGIVNYDELRRMFGGPQMDIELKNIRNALKKAYPTQILFYLRNGRFIVAASKPFEIKEIKNHMVSIGTIEFPQDLSLENGQQLIEVTSDVFSRFDRDIGKRKIVVDHDHIMEINHNLKVQKSLNNAIKNDNIQVYLQPIYSVEEKRITGAEALARIDDPDLGMIQPYDFIPIAEKNGYIIKIGEAVFRKTCSFIQQNKDDRLQWVNINLSPIQCVADEPISELIKIAEEYGVSGNKLRLEITEEAMVDEDELRDKMLKLSGHGFCFELDDFGVGFSNVMRLSNYPFTAVKIDRELVWQYHENPNNSILPHLIDDIRRSGMDVVAEGIESRAMGKEMVELGCNYLQGFYFSRPVPIKRFSKVFDIKWQDV